MHQKGWKASFDNNVASLLIPPGSEIVSAKGRAFPAVSYPPSSLGEKGGREGGKGAFLTSALDD